MIKYKFLENNSKDNDVKNELFAAANRRCDEIIKADLETLNSWSADKELVLISDCCDEFWEVVQKVFCYLLDSTTLSGKNWFEQIMDALYYDAILSVMLEEELKRLSGVELSESATDEVNPNAENVVSSFVAIFNSEFSLLQHHATAVSTKEFNKKFSAPMGIDGFLKEFYHKVQKEKLSPTLMYIPFMWKPIMDYLYEIGDKNSQAQAPRKARKITAEELIYFASVTPFFQARNKKLCGCRGRAKAKDGNKVGIKNYSFDSKPSNARRKAYCYLSSFVLSLPYYYVSTKRANVPYYRYIYDRDYAVLYMIENKDKRCLTEITSAEDIKTQIQDIPDSNNTLVNNIKDVISLQENYYFWMERVIEDCMTLDDSEIVYDSEGTDLDITQWLLMPKDCVPRRDKRFSSQNKLLPETHFALNIYCFNQMTRLLDLRCAVHEGSTRGFDLTDMFFFKIWAEANCSKFITEVSINKVNDITVWYDSKEKEEFHLKFYSAIKRIFSSVRNCIKQSGIPDKLYEKSRIEIEKQVVELINKICFDGVQIANGGKTEYGHPYKSKASKVDSAFIKEFQEWLESEQLNSCENMTQ